MKFLKAMADVEKSLEDFQALSKEDQQAFIKNSDEEAKAKLMKPYHLLRFSELHLLRSVCMLSRASGKATGNFDLVDFWNDQIKILDMHIKQRQEKI